MLGPATPAEQAYISSTETSERPSSDLVHGTNGRVDSSQDLPAVDNEMHSKLVVDRLSGLAKLDSNKEGMLLSHRSPCCFNPLRQAHLAAMRFNK